MHFTLSSVSFLFMFTTFVQSAPTQPPLNATELLNNALQAQQLNAQFQSSNSTLTGPCTNGATTCAQNAIATCVNGQFDSSNGTCSTTQQCFALPSVTTNGTTIACTSEKSAQSLINAAGASGGVTGSGSGNSTSSINPASASSTSSGANAPETTTSDPDCMTTTTTTTTVDTPTPTAASASVVTVTVTVTPSLTSVTQTLSPEQASAVLASLLGQGSLTATPSYYSSAPSEAVTSPTAIAAIVNNAGNSTSSPGTAGGSSGH